MNQNCEIDDTDRKLLKILQQSMPLTARPYKEIAEVLGISEDGVISRVKRFKELGLVKRIDFKIDLKKINLSSTLVACRISKRAIPGAKEIILSYKNITHNYLRDYKLNMWFTLCANPSDSLNNLLNTLKGKLKTKQMLSFSTKEIFKLEFSLKVK